MPGCLIPSRIPQHSRVYRAVGNHKVYNIVSCGTYTVNRSAVGYKHYNRAVRTLTYSCALCGAGIVIGMEKLYIVAVLLY